MVKALGIGGSPRKNGNSDILLDMALEGARSAGALVDKIMLNDLNLKGCQECGGCEEDGACRIRDDMQLVYEKFEDADAVLIASPIFFGSVSSQVKTMIDRFHCRWIKKHLLKMRPLPEKARKGVFLCVSAAQRRDFFENARQIIRMFFVTLDIAYYGDLYCGGVDSISAIKREDGSMDKSFELGAALVKSIIRQGRD